jgi:hypothetical protein
MSCRCTKYESENTTRNYFSHEFEVDRVPLLLLGVVAGSPDALVKDESVVKPLGEEVARDLDRVLDVVDLAHVEAVKTCKNEFLINRWRNFWRENNELFGGKYVTMHFVIFSNGQDRDMNESNFRRRLQVTIPNPDIISIISRNLVFGSQKYKLSYGYSVDRKRKLLF